MTDAPIPAPLLAAQDVACIRAERLVFRDLSFELAAGAALRLTGPNGSGKSSLLRLLAGLGEQAAGAILWRGAPIAADRDAHRRRTLFVGHQDAVKASMTPRELLGYWTLLAGARADAGSVLDRVGLGAIADLPGRLLSAGQKRRVALARLAAIPAELWLLDEPTVGLDAEAAAAFEEMLAGHCAGGGAAVVATHLPVGPAEAGEVALGVPPKSRAASG